MHSIRHHPASVGTQIRQFGAAQPAIGANRMQHIADIARVGRSVAYKKSRCIRAAPSPAPG